MTDDQHKTPPADQELGFKQVAQSVAAAAFGVQSGKNRERDFSKGKPSHFIALGLIFTIFICYVSVQMILNIKPQPHRELPGTLGTSLVGAIIGGISCLVAIGGGVLSVPFMTWCNVKVQNAIGTSAAIGFPIALGGALGYVWNGWSVAGLPEGSLGFVYLPAVVVVAAASILTAPIGARKTHELPVKTLKRVFAAVLLALAGKMLWSLFSAP